MTTNSALIEFGSPNLYLSIGSSRINVYMLNDGRHMVALQCIQKIFGYEGKSEVWLFNILSGISKFSKIPQTTMLAFEEPIIANFKSSIYPAIKLIPANIFIESCQIMVDAKNEGLVGVHYLKATKIAEKIVQQITEHEINALIQEACGFNIFKEEMKNQLLQYLQKQIEEPALVWIKTFPDAFFNGIFKAHHLGWPDLKMKPDTLGKLIYETVLNRINPELLQELRIQQPKRTYRKKNYSSKHNSHSALNNYLINLVKMMETSAGNWFIFLQLLNRTYPIVSSSTKFAPPAQNQLSSFSNYLKKFT